ncbi:hypothetical protein V6N13_010138 [Hibiscus sabdariffa]|uniref:Uncharacterized protein n=1 Tax=Hibiscus sabdariffa TaxID=183260 RepID=A0ABR2PQL9_9ROSI
MLLSRNWLRWKGVHVLSATQHESGVALEVSIVPDTEADVVTVSDVAESVQNSQSIASKENLRNEAIVAARDKVMIASTSLHPTKDIAIRVVEDGVKMILKYNNGKATYGPVRKVNSKGVNRSASMSFDLNRKGGKLRKSEDGSKKPVVVSDFSSDMTKKLLFSRFSRGAYLCATEE